MTFAITPAHAIRNYQNAYAEFFGTKPPAVRKFESGGFDIGFNERTKRFCKSDLLAVTSMMVALKDEVY